MLNIEKMANHQCGDKLPDGFIKDDIYQTRNSAYFGRDFKGVICSRYDTYKNETTLYGVMDKKEMYLKTYSSLDECQKNMLEFMAHVAKYK